MASHQQEPASRPRRIVWRQARQSELRAVVVGAQGPGWDQVEDSARTQRPSQAENAVASRRPGWAEDGSQQQPYIEVTHLAHLLTSQQDEAKKKKATTRLKTTAQTPGRDQSGISAYFHTHGAEHGIVVYYPRAGLGNKLLGLASSIVTAVALNRTLFFAPPDEREHFACEELFAPAVCSLEMPANFRVDYERAKGNASTYRILHPEAWGGTCRSQQKREMRDIMCDGQLVTFNPQFLAVSSCQYHAGLWFANPHAGAKKRLQEVFPDGVFSAFMSDWLKPSEPIQQRIQSYVNAHRMQGSNSKRAGERCISIHMRHNDPALWNKAVKCVESLNFRARVQENQISIFLSTMHKEIKELSRAQFGAAVHWATDETPHGNLGNAGDEKNAMLDAFLLSHCDFVLLTSLSTFGHVARAIAVKRRSPVLMSDTWGDGCANEVERLLAGVSQRSFEPPSDLLRLDHANSQILDNEGVQGCGTVPSQFLIHESI